MLATQHCILKCGGATMHSALLVVLTWILHDFNDKQKFKIQVLKKGNGFLLQAEVALIQFCRKNLHEITKFHESFKKSNKSATKKLCASAKFKIYLVSGG